MTDLIPRNVMAQLDSLADEPLGIDKILRLDHVLVEALRYQKLLGKVMSIALALLRDNWEQILERDPSEIQDIWKAFEKLGFEPPTKDSYSFESYAIARTGFEWPTISNLIRVAKPWYLKEGPISKQIPDKIKLIDPITREETGDTIDFDPLAVDWTKLSLCTRPLKDGEMTTETWGLLANPSTTFSQLRSHTMQMPQAQGQNRRIIAQDGLMLVVSATQPEPRVFGNLDIDSEDEDVMWAVNRILVSCGIRVS